MRPVDEAEREKNKKQEARAIFWLASDGQSEATQVLCEMVIVR